MQCRGVTDRAAREQACFRSGMRSRTVNHHVPSDDRLARVLADAAGALLLEIRSGAGEDEAALRKAGDAGAHELLVRLLAEHRPEDAVLSEEGQDDPRRLSADRVWIVDPLDGT